MTFLAGYDYYTVEYNFEKETWKEIVDNINDKKNKK